MRGQTSASPKTEQKSQSPSRADEVSTKDKQRSNVVSSSALSSQPPTKYTETVVKKQTNPPVNAWLKPLQETINEKAAKAAAAATSTAQNNAKSKAATSDPVISSAKTSLPTTASSSYAWSVVVGSTATTCASAESVPVPLMGKSGEKSATSKALQVGFMLFTVLAFIVLQASQLFIYRTATNIGMIHIL